MGCVIDSYVTYFTLPAKIIIRDITLKDCLVDELEESPEIIGVEKG
jgi:hypothetical protein